MRRWLPAMLLPLCAACATRHSVVDAFPPGASADPWVLQGAVWSGSFADAVDGLGDDAAAWQRYNPTQAWLAIYCRNDHPEHCLKVRIFGFASPVDARAAYDAALPLDPKPYQIGDVGCWTELGVLCQWGRLVIDVFGEDTSWGSQVQSSLLATYLGRRMPPGIPDNPQ
jgi:hypothetical protein